MASHSKHDQLRAVNCLTLDTMSIVQWTSTKIIIVAIRSILTHFLTLHLIKKCRNKQLLDRLQSIDAAYSCTIQQDTGRSARKAPAARPTTWHCTKHSWKSSLSTALTLHQCSPFVWFAMATVCVPPICSHWTWPFIWLKTKWRI